MHDCVNCGAACYCHGDIDDCPVETPEYAYMHCVGCGCEEDEFDDGDDYYDDDWCEECGTPVGVGRCDGCVAVSSMANDEQCHHCGAKYDGGHRCGSCGNGDPLNSGEFDPETGEQWT